MGRTLTGRLVTRVLGDDARDTAQPAPQALGLLHLVQAPPGRDERLLGDFVALAHAAGDGKGERVNQVLIALEQLRQRAVIPVAGRMNELRVAGRTSVQSYFAQGHFHLNSSRTPLSG